MKPLCIDLCCGSGGWTAGFMAEDYDVIGFDIEPLAAYPAQLVLQDVRTLIGSQFARATVIVASPPCEQFSRHAMPWTRKRNPPEPDLTIVEACWRIAREAGVPMIVENVRAAQAWLGTARAHVGPFYLWGDVPAILPVVIPERKKESFGSKQRLERARVPLELARYIARTFRPESKENAA